MVSIAQRAFNIALGMGVTVATALAIASLPAFASENCQSGNQCTPPPQPTANNLPTPFSGGGSQTPPSGECKVNCTPPPQPTPPPLPSTDASKSNAAASQSITNTVNAGDTRVNTNSAAAVFNFGQGPEGASVFKAGANGFVCQAPITTLEVGGVGSLAGSHGGDSFYAGQPTAYTATAYGRVNIPLGGSGLKAQCSNMLTLQQCVALINGGIDIIDPNLVDPRLAKMCPGLGKKTLEVVVTPPPAETPKPTTIYVQPPARPSVLLPPAPPKAVTTTN